MNTHKLIAWIAQQTVGALCYHNETGLFSFRYQADWVKNAAAFPISPGLPFQRPAEQTDALHSVDVRRFFENLLPEGNALDAAALAHAVSRGNLFGLLQGLGKETTGALSLLPEDTQPSQVTNLKREVTYEELSERICDRANRPFSVWDGRVRMSIAGYQDKLAVYMEDEKHIFLVEGQLASTHILKPEPMHPRLVGLVANEHFCMRIAKSLEIPVAGVNILRVPEPVLVIQRFDRVKHTHHVERLHVVDACQALKLGSDYKYERNFGNRRDVANIRDGVSFEKLFSVSTITQTEAATRMALLRLALLQYFIGNSDAHGKNISFLVEPGGLRLAPIYDLVAVCIYADIEHDFAMAIGDEFDASKVRAFDWADFAQRCHIERRLLVREMNRMIKSLRAQLPPLLTWSGYTESERHVLQRIVDFALQQADQMEKDARLVTQIEL